MRNKQGVIIAALIIAIVGLSIGFAAFSNTLTIRSSATLNPDSSTFRVVFSKSSSDEVVGEANSVLPDSNTYGDGATIDNTTQGESILKDLHAKFTEPNQTVKYNLYVYNAGSYQAQLTGVTFKNVTGESVLKKCTATTKQDTTQMATQSLVNSACEGISISVKVGNKVARPGDTSLNYQILDSHTSLPVEVTITYAEGSAYADGDFEVEFGDIEISATSAVDPSLVVTPQTSPVAGTYEYYMGYMVDLPITQIVLNPDGETGIVTVNMGGTFQQSPATYSYNNSNDTVTISALNTTIQVSYVSKSNNEILYIYDSNAGRGLLFTTNGSTDIAPLEGRAYGEDSPNIVFGSNGTFTYDQRPGEEGKYAVIDNHIFTHIGTNVGYSEINPNYTQFQFGESTVFLQN